MWIKIRNLFSTTIGEICGQSERSANLVTLDLSFYTVDKAVQTKANNEGKQILSYGVHNNEKIISNLQKKII